MNLEFHTRSASETEALAPEILRVCKNRKIFAIFGELGAGKTTLVKAVCKALGVEDAVKSPTFSLVNEYLGPGIRVFHFDFYRIRSEAEAWDIGFEEYLGSGHRCFIEWPEHIPGLIPPEAVYIRISSEGPEARKIELDFEELPERKL